MNVRIDDYPYPSFPRVPQEGLRIRINGQVRVITDVVVDANTSEFQCVSKPVVDPEEQHERTTEVQRATRRRS